MTFDIAIAGIGAVAELHARSIRDIDGASLVAGSCRTESKGLAFAEQFDCQWYGSTADMLDGEGVDVLSICTPSGLHLDATLAAAERGVHVLCEKPLEITSERIDRMIAVCTEADVRLGGIFQQRYNPVVRTVHDAAAEGRFGDLAVALATVPWWRDDDYYEDAWQGTKELDGGGALLNQSIHTVDVLQWLLGATSTASTEDNPIDEVFAYTATSAHDESIVEVEDSAVAVFKSGDGTIGQFLGATSMYPGSLKRIHLGGREGTAEIREDELVTWRFRDERDNDDDLRDRYTETAGGGGAADPMSIEYDNHRRNIEDYLSSLAAEEAYALAGSEARKAVDIIESMYASADRGEPVSVS